MRIGHGFDVHAFAPGRPLMLACVHVPYDRGLAGHSDADVAAHALVDALLGAAALGDLGAMFPSSDERWAGAPGRQLLALAVARIREHGYAIANADVTIVAQNPKLSPYVDAMRRAVAAALEIDINDVSVKATTTDSLGFTGRGEGIAAFAGVLLQ